MPHLNTLGQAANGVGSTTINWEGQALPRQGGGSVWFSNQEFLYQRENGPDLTIEGYNTQTGAYRTVVGHGANWLQAGGGQWATFLVDRDGIDYEDSYGNTNNEWYPMHISDAGVIAVCKYGTGVGLVTGKDKVFWVDPNTPVLRLEACVQDGIVTWHDGTRLRAWQATTGELQLPLLPLLGVRHDDGYMLGYHPTYALVVYRLGERYGWVVSPDGKDFGPDIRVVSGKVIVKSSFGEGEFLPNLPKLGLREYVVDISAPTVDLAVVAPPLPQPFVDEPPNRVLKFSPINATVEVIGRDYVNTPPPYRFITVSGAEAGPADQRLQLLTTAITEARKAGQYLLAYSDERNFPLSAVPRGDEDGGPRIRVVCGQQCYPTAGAPVADTKREVDLSVKHLQQNGHEVEMLLAFYRQVGTTDLSDPMHYPKYNWTLDESLGTIEAGVEIARTRKVKAFHVFVYERGWSVTDNLWRDGVVSRPEFVQTLANLEKAAKLEPEPLPPPPVPDPLPIPEPAPMSIPNVPLPPQPEPAPESPQTPSGAKRKPNIAKALRTFANLLVGIFKPHGTPARYRPKPIEEPPVDSPQPIDPPVVEPPPPVVLPTWPSREDVLKYRGHLCNLKDSKGGVIWTPALPGATEETFKEWTDILRQNGATHLPFGPFTPGEIYPGIGIINPDWTHNSAELRKFVQKILNTPSASGKGFVPVIFLDSGDPDPKSRTRAFFQVALAALGDLVEHCIVLPAGWEPEAYSAKEISDALKEWKALSPNSIIGYHGWPRRLVGSSNPIQPDDPWQGGESVFFTSNGGEFIDIAFYQTEHGDSIYHDADPDDDAGGNWLNRLQDYLSRIGAGFHGWRVMPFVAFETVAYEFFRNKATADQARDVASRIKKVADKWNIQIGYGNGLPWEI